MGISTAQQLIERAKNFNEYNNSGVSSTAKWVDFMNSALIEMVDDLSLEEFVTIEHIPGQRTYDLPSDYYSLVLLNDNTTNNRLAIRRHYDQKYPYGYWVVDKGDKHQIDLLYTSPSTLTLLYKRYPKLIELSNIASQKPEVPTAGETALCYKAVKFALLNNNQIGQAEYFEKLYKDERANIKTATARARGV